jgi:hypothetical protein
MITEDLTKIHNFDTLASHLEFIQSQIAQFHKKITGYSRYKNP